MTTGINAAMETRHYSLWISCGIVHRVQYKMPNRLTEFTPSECRLVAFGRQLLENDRRSFDCQLTCDVLLSNN